MNNKKPTELREAFRNGLAIPTTGLAHGYAQANLVIMPSEYAFDFLVFCQNNPKAVPILEVGSKGDPIIKTLAKDDDKGSDVRFDIPAYNIYRFGELTEEVQDISEFWNDDSVFFLTGCGFGFEGPLRDAGIPVRHIDSGTNCPSYDTNIDCVESGPFKGKMIVSMRAIPGSLVAKAVMVTSKYPASHGAPVYIGNPEGIGIADINKPDYGDKPVIEPGDVLVFWACGITSQKIAGDAKLPLVIGHAPGYMYVTDVLNEELQDI